MADDDLHADEPLDRLPGPRKRYGGLIVTVAILVIFGVVIWYAYQRVTQTGEPMAPPLIKADQGPVKVSPESPGGMQVPNQDKAIYDRIGNGGEKSGSVEKLLPPPETPKPEAPAPAKSADAGRAVAVAPLAPPPDASQGATAATAVPPGTPPAPAPSALDKPPTPPSGATPPASAPVPATTAKTAAASPPAAKTTVAPSASPATPAAATTAAAPGTVRIQLGAFRQAADAEKTWQKLSQKFADLLGGLSPSIVQVDLGAKGIYQRLQAGPLADRAAAAATCEKLKALKQDCIVALR
jgi:cell division septation protein DedD